MEEKEIIGVIINIIVWPIIIYFFFKSRVKARARKKEIEEFNKPENRFKRELHRLELTLEPFTKRYFYPYILCPSYQQKQVAVAANYLHSGFDPHTFRNLKDIRIGHSEPLLYAHLVKRFGYDNIFLWNHSLYGYYPDVIYADTAKKIYIDIEIDEPYAKITNEPLHYLHLSRDSYGKANLLDLNKERDDAITKYGWTIIRFAENHVLNSPNECCDIVNHVINYWSLQASNYNLKNIKIAHHKRWTKEEAIQMSQSKIRQFK